MGKIIQKSDDIRSVYTGPTANSIRLSNPLFIVSFLCLWLLVLWLIPNSLTVIFDYFSFALLGVIGAIFANSTGAGGGVVFIPMFNQLGFTEIQAIATSFGIQCFGMTAGAFTWCHFYRNDKSVLNLWHSFVPIIAVTAFFSVLGVWAVYGPGLASPASLHTVFSIFSILLGLAILLTVFATKPNHRSTHGYSSLVWYDWLMLIVIGVSGGVITAWLSVGVGEMLAVYLILRRFDATMAVATAVVVSAITVWSAAPQHFIFEPNAYWQVLVFAGPGAVLGGIFAKTLVIWLSARKLKIFFACWILIMGIVSSPIAAY